MLYRAFATIQRDDRIKTRSPRHTRNFLLSASNDDEAADILFAYLKKIYPNEQMEDFIWNCTLTERPMVEITSEAHINECKI